MERRWARTGQFEERDRRKARWRRAAVTRSREMRILFGLSEPCPLVAGGWLSDADAEEAVSMLRPDIRNRGSSGKKKGGSRRRRRVAQ